MPMKVLVTGSSGQLARSMVERAAAQGGVEIVALGRPVLDLETPGSATRAIADIGPDIVINAAAFTAVDHAEDEAERAFRVNAAGAGEVAAAAREAGARIIQISTDYVFDGSGTGAYREDAPPRPLGVYGRSKLEGEEQVRAANPDHLILRTAWVYSPFGRNFVKTMLSLAAGPGPVKVVGDQHGNPSSALDLADGLLAVLERWSADPVGLGGTYHLAGTGTASWFDFARFIFETRARSGGAVPTLLPIRTRDWPTRALRPAYSVLDSGRFARDFGFVMPHWQPSAALVVQRLATAS
jgi:dTDP-4-dehydrorhamnose reductase